MAKSKTRAEAFSIGGARNAEQAQATETATEGTETPVAAQNASGTVRNNGQSRDTLKKQADGVKTRQVTVYLPVPLYKQLRIDAVEQDASMTNIVIRLLKKHYNM